jgi:hypothetical protein
MPYDLGNDEYLDDSEYPDDPDFDDGETDPCPHCGEDVYDDAERCPHCGRYLSREDAPWSKPWWLVLGVVTCLAIVLFWIVRG